MRDDLSTKDKVICVIFVCLGIIGLFGMFSEIRGDKKARNSYTTRQYEHVTTNKKKTNTGVKKTTTTKTTTTSSVSMRTSLSRMMPAWHSI